MSSFFLKIRLWKHLGFVLAGVVFLAISLNWAEPQKLKFWISMLFGYSSIVLLGLTLVIGPWNIMTSKANPLSLNFRRDIGIWAAIFGLIHVIAGLQVHMKGRFWLYFFFPENEQRLIPLRYSPFGLANYTGLLATLILIVLLVTSNNISMRKLGPKRWKKIQMTNYFCAILIIMHGILYQIIEKRTLSLVIVFSIIVLVVSGFRWKVYLKAREVGKVRT